MKLLYTTLLALLLLTACVSARDNADDIISQSWQLLAAGDTEKAYATCSVLDDDALQLTVPQLANLSAIYMGIAMRGDDPERAERALVYATVLMTEHHAEAIEAYNELLADPEKYESTQALLTLYQQHSGRHDLDFGHEEIDNDSLMHAFEQLTH